MPHSHSLFRLASKIYNTPQLITQESFNVILDYLDKRNSEIFKLEQLDPEDFLPDDDDSNINEDMKVGVLTVDGSLTYKPVYTMCGEVGTSYQALVNQTQEMAEAGIKTIVMQVTSGGGAADHCFECAEEVRSICDENDIKLIGYADGYACSAAYAWICACDEVIVNPSATVGSIGCVIALMDTSKAYEKAGLKRIFITSGENKVPFDADGAFKQDFLDRLQAEVDQLNLEFTTHVSKYTGLSADTINGFQAQVFNAKDAVENGLANRIMTNKEFATFIANLENGA